MGRLYSRRSIVRGGIAAGGSMVFAAGCSGNGPPRTPATAAREPAETPEPVTATATAATIAAPSAAAPARGGKATVMAPRAFTFDTLDAQQSGDLSTIEILGRTHSRLVAWRSFEEPILAGDLASSWEIPAPDVLVLRMNPAARWQQREPLNGRAVTAEDVAAHLRRTLALAGGGKLPQAQRAHEFANVRRVTAAGDSVRIETDGPAPFLLHTLAGRFAFVQPPEAVASFAATWQEARPREVVGSGPFLYNGRTPAGGLLFAANAGGHARPILDELAVAAPFDPVGAYQRGDAHQVIARDRRDAANLLALGATPGVRLEEQPVLAAMYVGAPPWNDARLTAALSIALNRPALAAALFGGRARTSGTVAPVFGQFALTSLELSNFPGFRAELQEDIATARSLWAAGGGPALGPVTVDFPSIFDPAYSASTTTVARLNSALGGAQFRPAVETYTTIARKAVEHRYGSGSAAFWFGWGPTFFEPDPSRFLIETFHSGGPGSATTGFSSPEVDALLDRLAGEFDMARRRSAVTEVARLLQSGSGGLLNLLVQEAGVFSVPGLVRAPLSPFPDQHRDAQTSRA